MKKIPRGVKKYIRREKSRIRKSDAPDKELLINKIYEKYANHKRDIQPGDKKGN